MTYLLVLTTFLLLSQKEKFSILFLLFIPLLPAYSAILNPSPTQTPYKEIRGYVLDKKTKQRLEAASIQLKNTNIATVTNEDGEFRLKIPDAYSQNTVIISYLGYLSVEKKVSNFTLKSKKIYLQRDISELGEVAIEPKDPITLLKKVLQNKADNYLDQKTIMTAFYRETIKKRRTFVSISEAVLGIYKNTYTASKPDAVKLYKARKSTDYNKIDTLTVKLQGGPATSLYIDVMKNSQMLFVDDMFAIYDFKMEASVKQKDSYLYCIAFSPKRTIKDPYFVGKLYIDSRTMALQKAIFNLDIQNESKVMKMFVRKKPSRAKITIKHANYQIDYQKKDGKWYYSYGKMNLGLKVNWDKKLFNSVYRLHIEMAITDWKYNDKEEILRPRERIKASSVLTDQVSGFKDSDFWGELNIIEPEKPITSAIRKIKKRLLKISERERNK